MIGTELGNYRIVDSLGQGGMGRVYVGEHRLLGRRAAIKVLDQKFDDDDTVKARFFNEARAVSALKHPSIVEVYDFGHAPDGRAYLVMELLTGESLGRRMKRGVMAMCAESGEVKGAFAPAQLASQGRQAGRVYVLGTQEEISNALNKYYGLADQTVETMLSTVSSASTMSTLSSMSNLSSL